MLFIHVCLRHPILRSSTGLTIVYNATYGYKCIAVFITEIKSSELVIILNNHLVCNTMKPFRHKEAYSRSGGGTAHSTKKHMELSPSPHPNKPWHFFFIRHKKQGSVLLNDENETWPKWKNAALHKHAVFWSAPCTEQWKQCWIQSMQVWSQRLLLSQALQ